MSKGLNRRQIEKPKRRMISGAGYSLNRYDGLNEYRRQLAIAGIDCDISHLADKTKREKEMFIAYLLWKSAKTRGSQRQRYKPKAAKP